MTERDALGDTVSYFESKKSINADGETVACFSFLPEYRYYNKSEEQIIYETLSSSKEPAPSKYDNGLMKQKPESKVGSEKNEQAEIIEKPKTGSALLSRIKSQPNKSKETETNIKSREVDNFEKERKEQSEERVPKIEEMKSQQLDNYENDTTLEEEKIKQQMLEMERQRKELAEKMEKVKRDREEKERRRKEEEERKRKEEEERKRKEEEERKRKEEEEERLKREEEERIREKEREEERRRKEDELRRKEEAEQFEKKLKQNNETDQPGFFKKSQSGMSRESSTGTRTIPDRLRCIEDLLRQVLTKQEELDTRLKNVEEKISENGKTNEEKLDYLIENLIG